MKEAEMLVILKKQNLHIKSCKKTHSNWAYLSAILTDTNMFRCNRFDFDCFPYNGIRSSKIQESIIKHTQGS